ncbi:unnamed protein product [Pleuronectes platessa]|uniref:MADF domain-containing protein n=1 Tax=Pleuronectes platessa TaxID=8262 RepID=A0A9N7UY19_PLEPL|nr:unnamed protein product [Pleuronectes platessa]
MVLRFQRHARTGKLKSPFVPLACLHASNMDHLYNLSLTEYKDAQMACNSWKEISANVGLHVDECTKLWRKIRDKFFLQKKGYEEQQWRFKSIVDEDCHSQRRCL